MRVQDLPYEQILLLKQDLLCIHFAKEQKRFPCQSELQNADRLITDEEVYLHYKEATFCA